MGLKDVGGRVGYFVGGGVMGLTGKDSRIKENVGIKLGLFLGALVDLEDDGDQVGSFVGGGVMGLTAKDSLVGEYAGIKLSACLVGCWWLTYDIGSTQPIEIVEVMKGSAGKMIDNAGGIGVDFSLAHNLMPGVGIGIHKMHTISCLYSPEALRAEDATGLFELSILNE